MFYYSKSSKLIFKLLSWDIKIFFLDFKMINYIKLRLDLIILYVVCLKIYVLIYKLFCVLLK